MTCGILSHLTLNTLYIEFNETECTVKATNEINSTPKQRSHCVRKCWAGQLVQLKYVVPFYSKLEFMVLLRQRTLLSCIQFGGTGTGICIAVKVVHSV